MKVSHATLIALSASNLVCRKHCRSHEESARRRASEREAIAFMFPRGALWSLSSSAVPLIYRDFSQTFRHSVKARWLITSTFYRCASSLLEEKLHVRFYLAQRPWS